MIELIASVEKNLAKSGEFTIKDGTTWGDPARGTKNLVLLIERFAKDEYIPLESTQVTPDNIPKAVTSWHIKDLRDAMYKYVVVAADDHNPTLTYGIDKVVYGSIAGGHTGLFVSLDENVPVDIALDNVYYWAPIIKISDFPFLTNNGSDSLTQFHVHDLASRVCLAGIALKYAGNNCDCPDSTVAKTYYWGLLYHHATIYSAAFGEYEEAGRYLDQVVDRCTNGSAEDESDCGCNG